MIEEPNTFEDWLQEDGLYWLCEDALTNEFMLMHDCEGLSQEHRIRFVAWPYDSPDGEQIFQSVWETLYAARTEAEKHAFDSKTSR